MGRIKVEIDVKGRKCWTLFDTGARNTYVSAEVASLLHTFDAERPLKSGLGGRTRQVTKTTVLDASVEGHYISTHAFVVDGIGTDEDGREIDVILGALTMQQWGIRPVPDQEKLDLSHYTDEFVEF